MPRAFRGCSDVTACLGEGSLLFWDACLALKAASMAQQTGLFPRAEWQHQPERQSGAEVQSSPSASEGSYAQRGALFHSGGESKPLQFNWCKSLKTLLAVSLYLISDRFKLNRITLR